MTARATRTKCCRRRTSACRNTARPACRLQARLRRRLLRLQDGALRQVRRCDLPSWLSATEQTFHFRVNGEARSPKVRFERKEFQFFDMGTTSLFIETSKRAEWCHHANRQHKLTYLAYIELQNFYTTKATNKLI